MDYIEFAQEARNNNRTLETLCQQHLAGKRNVLTVDSDIVAELQALLREEFGDNITLVHGSLEPIDPKIIWREDSSFTDQFDPEFSGEDGWLVEAVVPVNRVKFYLAEENEFVVFGGELNCTVSSVQEYFQF